jgi:large subunit ribosomal protein L18
MALSKINRRLKIKRRIRKKVNGTGSIPRLSVYRSNKQIYAQIIDDLSGKTLVSAASVRIKNQKTTKSIRLLK